MRIMSTPRSVDVEITSRCNLRCRYCYYFDNPEVEYRDLPAEEWLKFFDELGKCKVMDVTIQGGEPFIRKDLPLLIEGIVRNKMRFSILSNGTLINEEIAGSITKTGRCDYVQVSVDGSKPETHDSCRGEGSFFRAIRGIRTLQRHGVRVTVRVTVHRHNVNDLENTARLLLEDLGLARFSTNSAGSLGTCRRNAGNVLLTTRERQTGMEILKRLSVKYDGRISATAGPLAEARLWSRMEDAYAEGSSPFPNGGRLTACGCPSNKIAVRADGVIIPCSMLPHMELGRVNHDSFEEVWQSSATLNMFRQRHKIPLTEFEFCTDCPYLPYCTGNCPGLAYSLTGQVDHPSPDACLRLYLEDGGLLPKAEDKAI
ncbi:MAG: SynChlorMet cassette radical SAM/SPASM protein ScmE [Deltaproteobacteria bacterium]|nr:MAG: SynChlorMet cassette radical SAM/SPASM protein ScmE [Deltaproteobacteria bacterium]